MKTLLLGNGFVGSSVVRTLLDSEREIVVLGRVSKGPAAGGMSGVERVVGDFNDGGTLRRVLAGCDVVIHTGAYYPLFSVGCAAQARQAISELRSVLAACADAGISRFVFVSSPMVLAVPEESFRLSAYHYIKRMLHDEVGEWIGRGFPGTIVIPGGCFGPGDAKPTAGRLILEIASRRLRFYLAGIMNAVDVRDVANALACIVTKAEVSPCYQLGNWNCTVAEFAAEVARLAGVPAPAIRVPYQPTRTIARAAEWIQFHAGAKRPFLPCAGLDQAHFGAHLDSSLAVRDLGFRVRPIAATIQDTLDYFRGVGYLRRFSRHIISAGRDSAVISEGA